MVNWDPIDMIIGDKTNDFVLLRPITFFKSIVYLSQLAIKLTGIHSTHAITEKCSKNRLFCGIIFALVKLIGSEVY